MPYDPAEVLPPGRSRETEIRRDAAGRWFNGGSPITHTLLTRAFDEWLRPAPDGSGRFCLSNSINWAFVELEGAPRFVRSAVIGEGGVTLALSDGREVGLARETLREGPGGALYCDVPGVPFDEEAAAAGEPVGPMAARFDGHAMMQLAEILEEDDEGVFLRIGGAIVRPPVVADPLAPAKVSE